MLKSDENPADSSTEIIEESIGIDNNGEIEISKDVTKVVNDQVVEKDSYKEDELTVKIDS